MNGLLDQARHEEVLLQSADGSEFLLVAVDDFAQEILRTRQNERLMALQERGIISYYAGQTLAQATTFAAWLQRIEALLCCGRL
jgi:hypothetical protein